MALNHPPPRVPKNEKEKEGGEAKGQEWKGRTEERGRKGGGRYRWSRSRASNTNDNENDNNDTISYILRGSHHRHLHLIAQFFFVPRLHGLDHLLYSLTCRFRLGSSWLGILASSLHVGLSAFFFLFLLFSSLLFALI